MNTLTQQHCSPVRANTPGLSQTEIDVLAGQAPEWRIIEKEGEQRLERVFKFKDFSQAIDFSSRVAKVADGEDHHPSLLTEWGKVTVTWWTHVIHGLHLNDFIMAAKTDQLFNTQL